MIKSTEDKNPPKQNQKKKKRQKISVAKLFDLPQYLLEKPKKKGRKLCSKKMLTIESYHNSSNVSKI